MRGVALCLQGGREETVSGAVTVSPSAAVAPAPASHLCMHVFAAMAHAHGVDGRSGSRYGGRERLPASCAGMASARTAPPGLARREVFSRDASCRDHVC